MQANAKTSRIPQPTRSRIPKFQPLPCLTNVMSAKQAEPTSRSIPTSIIASRKASFMTKNSVTSNKIFTAPTTRIMSTTKHSVLTSKPSQAKKPITVIRASKVQTKKPEIQLSRASKFQTKKSEIQLPRASKVQTKTPEVQLSRAVGFKPLQVAPTKKPLISGANTAEKKSISKRLPANERRPFVNKENRVTSCRNSNYSQNCKPEYNGKINARNQEFPTITISEKHRTEYDDRENKENIVVPVHLSQQKDIVFEPSEFCRNLILNNRELSPSILKANQGFKLSVSERPSAYKKFPPVKDPFGEAMKAIDKLKAENSTKRETMEGTRVSLFQHLGSLASTSSIRNSAYKKFETVTNPYDEAMKAIDKLRTENQLKRLTIEREQTPLIKERESTALSPAIRSSIYKGSQSGNEGFSKMFQQRGSFLSPYQERLSVFEPIDPYKEAMKRIQDLRLKRSAKKKVTFATNLTEFVTTATIDEVAKKNLQSPSREARLTDISEKSEQSSNRSSKCDDFCQTPRSYLNVAKSGIHSFLEDICNASPTLVTNTALCKSENPTSKDIIEIKETLKNNNVQQSEDIRFIRTLGSDSVSGCSESKFEAPQSIPTDSCSNANNYRNLTPRVYTCTNLTAELSTPAVDPFNEHSKADIYITSQKQNATEKVELDFTDCEEQGSFTNFISSIVMNGKKTTETTAVSFSKNELELQESVMLNCGATVIDSEFPVSVDQSLWDLKFEEYDNINSNVGQNLILTGGAQPGFKNLDQRDSFDKLLDSIPVPRETVMETITYPPNIGFKIASVLPACNSDETCENTFVTPVKNMLILYQNLVDDELENLPNVNSHLNLDEIITVDELSNNNELNDRDSFTKLLDNVPFCRNTNDSRAKYSTALKNTTNEKQHLDGFSHEGCNSVNLENSSIVKSNRRVEPDFRDCPNTFRQYRSSPSNSMKTYSELSSVFKARASFTTQNMREHKLVTPQPISVNPHSRFMSEVSPDFLNGRLSNITSIDSVPIHTPLILKSLSRRESGNSPRSVRTKIIFEEDGPQRPQMVTRSPAGKLTDCLPTRQMVYNVLANEEVNFYLKNHPDISFSCRIPNPLAVTLEEGGEMHFQPIQ